MFAGRKLLRSLVRFAAFAFFTVAGVCCALTPTAQAVELQVATFAVDVTPPIGSPLCLGLVPRATGVNDPLTARGVVLLADDQLPIVLTAVDWVGIGNASHELWRTAIAAACKTTPDRVAVQTLHQHDAPGCDLGAEAIAAAAGLEAEFLNRKFSEQTVQSVAQAAAASLSQAQRVTHLGHGVGVVDRVASNRRILGDDGKVAYQRMSSAGDQTLQELPEGTIDRFARVVSFWKDDQPLAVLSYYATHPQSYYRTGQVSADFVGLARHAREIALPGVPLIHFNGASGNVAAGKYNDGGRARRAELAERLAAGLKAAWEATEKAPIDDADFGWKSVAVEFPLADWLQRDELESVVHNEAAPTIDRLQAARALSFLDRHDAGRSIVLTRLRIGEIDLVHLPGEPFVEYQLASQQIQPKRFVCVAGYGDYGPGYIGLSRSYAEGGYETGRPSRVSPRVETVLMQAIEELSH